MNALSSHEPQPLPQSTTPVLPFSRPLPLGLLRWAYYLTVLQRIALALFVALVALACGLYWLTFHTQHRWEDAYQQLASLRQQTREMVILNDALAGDLAGDTVIPAALKPATVSQTVVLPALPERAPRPAQPPQPLSLLDAPVGY